MNLRRLVLVCCFLGAVFAAGQNPPKPKTDAGPSTVDKASVTKPDCNDKVPEAAAQSSPDELKNVLAQANKAAETFKTAKAKFQWDQYECVVDETDVQKGEVYFRRSKTGMDASVHVTSPHTKQVTFVDGTLKLFQPESKQLTIYDARTRRTEVESLMNIGFGTRSDDMLKSYEVKMEAWETVDGVKTARLNLTPRNEKLKASVANIILWLDPLRDVSVQQKFMERGGNYRLTHYMGIEINGKISKDAFELKTPSGTTTVRP